MPSEILIYQTRDGSTRIDVRVEEDSVWLTQNQLADVFQTTKQNISLHIQNILESGELETEATVKEYLTVQTEGRRKVKRTIAHYNLDMIISVGYRVNSHVGVHFRRWATERLREYIIKGFVLDDERLKEARNNYFDELLKRIRDIRSSEKVFYRKVCDIYATSIDYDRSAENSRNFFAQVQNKFHWAITGLTAAELIVQRADATKPHMGLTSWPTQLIREEDVLVAKNYLGVQELDQLNRIVNQYLEYAELQAMQRKPMRMADWKKKLDDFLTFNEREVLSHAGSVSHEEAAQHARKEYDQYRKQLEATTPDELDRAVKRLRTGPKQTKK
ncbi:MAG TPA: virulence RhuM family protein [Flavobacteriales bacterium]|nr:virulence RhuM family protein [Flavobacteriales bacterium]HMR28638.1 virulence RhuM family protein [Flavobacteriales bacterium]